MTYRTADAPPEQAEETSGEVTADGENGEVPLDQTGLEPDGPRPVMALAVEQMAIKAGQAFDPLSVVRGVADDKDDANALYQNIHADGTFDVKTRGTYEIRYYVTDSDGNASDPHIFTLTVE